MGGTVVLSGDRFIGGFMHRRFSLLVALCAGALAAVVALPLVSACQHKPEGSSILASDAQAADSGGGTAEAVRQTGPLPSLAPLVKQLRPVVVNINSRFKPRRP